MKNRFTLLLAFCLMAISFLHAQTVQTVATGMGSNFGMSAGGNAVYKRSVSDVLKADLSQALPAPAISFLTGITNLRGVLVVGDYLYLTCTSSNLPGLSCSVGRVNLTATNPTIEAVAGNLTGSYGTVGMTTKDNDLYIGATGGTLNGLYKVNLGEPFPQNATAVMTGEPCFQIALYGNDLYFNDPSYSAIKKLDISQSNPAITTVVSGGQMVGLTSYGDHLYFCDLLSPAGIKRIDLTQPVPVIETILPGEQNVNTLAKDGNYLYFGDTGGKVSRVIIDDPDFSPLPAICANTAPSGLGGATPAGGTYSGPGVTDNGDGSTFSFDPAAAGGPGTYTIVYTLSNGLQVSSPLTVLAPPIIGVFGFMTDVSVPPSPLPDPEQGPAGGVYSGIGVLPGNIFDAGLAGAGVHVLTYTFTDANGCTGVGTGTILVNLPGNDACDGANDISGLFGGPQNVAQISSLYDNTAYTSTGEPGSGYECHVGDPGLKHTIWYRFTGDGNTYRIRAVRCSATTYNDDTQTAIYSGDCNSLTPVACNDDEDKAHEIYNFSVELATVPGLSYRMLVDGYGEAQGEFCLEVTRLTAIVLPADDCADAHDISSLFGGAQNVPQTSTLYNNIGYTSTNDPSVASGCFFNNAPLKNSVWFSFTGDGSTYRIRSVQCSATHYIPSGDTRAAVFTGTCSSPVQVACNDDEDFDAHIYNFNLELATQSGETYRILVDGFEGNQGEFCIEVTKLVTNAITDINGTNIRLFPNPTQGLIQLTNVRAEQVQVFDNTGRLLRQVHKPGAQLDITDLPAGMYFIKITEGEQAYTARVVRE